MKDNETNPQTDEVKGLRAELAGRKRGQKLASDDFDHYEEAWKEEVKTLRSLLSSAVEFIGIVGSDTDEVQIELVEKCKKALGEVPEESKDPHEDADVEVTIDLLGLVVECEIPHEVIAGWSQEQRNEAARWAGQQHLLASDNEFTEDEIVPKPLHVTELQKSQPKRAGLDEVSMERSETRR